MKYLPFVINEKRARTKTFKNNIFYFLFILKRDKKKKLINCYINRNENFPSQ